MLELAIKMLALTVSVLTISGCASTKNKTTVKSGESISLKITGEGEYENKVALIAEHTTVTKNEDGLTHFSTTLRNVSGDRLAVRVKVVFHDGNLMKAKDNNAGQSFVIEPWQSHYFYQTASSPDENTFDFLIKFSKKTK